MKVIFRPASAAAAAAKPDAIKLAGSLPGGEGVANREINGFLLRATGDGKRVIVYAIDLPIILALGVHGNVEIGLHAIDGMVFYPLGVKTLVSPPAGLAVPLLPYGRHSAPIEVVTIGGPANPALSGYVNAHYAGYSLENSRSLTTTKARYAANTNNNPLRKPYLVIHRATAALGADAQGDAVGTFGRLSRLGKIQINIEALNTPLAGGQIYPGEALEWGPGYGCGQFAQSHNDVYLAFYKITEQASPAQLIGEVQSVVDLKAEGFDLTHGLGTASTVTTSTGIASASAMTGVFSTDADRAVHLIAFNATPEVQESTVHNGTTHTLWKRQVETHLVKVLPDGSVTSIKLTDHWRTGPSSGVSYHSFSTFPEGYELNKIGAVLAPAVEGQPRQVLIVALRTPYVTVEEPESANAPARFTATEDTYAQLTTASLVVIIREDGAMQAVSIPGYIPVGADDRRAEGASISPRYLSMRYRSVACEYSADYFALLVAPLPADLFDKQVSDWNFHVAVIHKVTGALHAVTPVLGTYPRYPGQVSISCVEQGVFEGGVITQHARLLISVMSFGSSLNAVTWVQPTTIYMLPDLTALAVVATTDYFAEAHYLGNAIAPAKVGRSTGMSSSRTGIGPVTPP